MPEDGLEQVRPKNGPSHGTHGLFLRNLVTMVSPYNGESNGKENGK